jgi:L-aminopeptidase/D-esterase-like protein
MGIDLAGVKIGHATDETYYTGCTVFLCPEGTTGCVDVRGPAPGSRESALMALEKPEKNINGLVFTGGSAFGLATADGVMRYLAEQGIGHFTPIRPIPIVPAAVVYDLFFSSGDKFPDADMGYTACQQAREADVAQGNVGAGAGVTVGKWGGFRHTIMKGGFGLATIKQGDLLVTAAAVVNAVGDVVNEDGSVLAGARKEDGTWLVADNPLRFVPMPQRPEVRDGMNTTLVAVITNARLERSVLQRVTQRVHDGMAIAIRPVHTRHDGDTAFALSTNAIAEAEENLVGNTAVAVTAEAIRNAVRNAESVGPVPGLASE